MKIRQRFGGLLVAALLLFTSLFTGTAFAAGSASFTVEPEASSVNPGTRLNLNFYVTASGANLYGASINVNLTNMTFYSFNKGSTPFYFSDTTLGGSVGSQSFQISSSYNAPSVGAQGKQFMGTVAVDVSGTPGTATIALSGGAAPDGSFNPMSASSSNGSVTIAAPATPPAATCPSGQTGTPPNCITPDTNTGSTNPATNPNKNSTAAVPSADGTKSEAVSEQAIADAYDATQASAKTTTVATTSAKKKTANMTFYALGGVALLAILGGAAFFFLRQRRFAGFGTHAASSQVFSSSMMDSAPHTPEQPAQDSSKNDPTNPSSGSGSGPAGPTVITPQ